MIKPFFITSGAALLPLTVAILLTLSACTSAPQTYTANPSSNSASVPAQIKVQIPPVAGLGIDAAFERSSLPRSTFYKNIDALLKQVDANGRMGVNRPIEPPYSAEKPWYIEEQRFADSIIGAGVNQNRPDLIDAGLRALEWGFARQQIDGGFNCKDAYLSTAYFVAATAHSLWVLDNTGYSRDFQARVNAIKEALGRSALWLLNAERLQANTELLHTSTSRYFLLGYALAESGRMVKNAQLIDAGDRLVQTGVTRQHASGYFFERGGFDSSFQAEGLVYLLRYDDHAASAEQRARLGPGLRRGLNWLSSRVSANGVVSSTGNTRSGAKQEQDRTGGFRLISSIAVARALGLGALVVNDPKLEIKAKAVLNPKGAA